MASEVTVAEIARICEALGPDERRVVYCVATRLKVGMIAYGKLDIVGDKRSWRAEAAAEALDMAVYLSCELLKAPRPTE